MEKCIYSIDHYYPMPTHAPPKPRLLASFQSTPTTRCNSADTTLPSLLKSLSRQIPRTSPKGRFPHIPSPERKTPSRQHHSSNAPCHLVITNHGATTGRIRRITAFRPARRPSQRPRPRACCWGARWRERIRERRRRRRRSRRWRRPALRATLRRGGGCQGRCRLRGGVS